MAIRADATIMELLDTTFGGKHYLWAPPFKVPGHIYQVVREATGTCRCKRR